MRQETNNEMDLLLRRLSRRDGVPASEAVSDHLDPDELSSYAENVVPAAARARYTEHLAECSRCRELVVQLSASVPVFAAKETMTAAGSSGLKKFLASLFSPMVLRYAVPALALIVAAAIGIVMLRSNRSATLVADLERPEPVTTAKPAQPETLSRGVVNTQAQKDSQSPAASTEKRTDLSKYADAPAPPNAPPVVGAVRVEPKADAAAQKTEQQAAPTPTPAQPSPKPAETMDEMRVEIEGRSATPQTRRVAQANEAARETAKAEDKKTDELATARAASAKTPKMRAQGAGTEGNFSLRDGPEKDGDDGLIRSVAGRRFRKQSGVWVDTAYGSGSATTNIARGSEQYRALVADEPGIKEIADHLGGPFIVVWKGRAYRIR